MANCRPAGFSDEDSDDDYGFNEKLDRNLCSARINDYSRPKLETKLQDAIINGDLDGTAKIISEDLKNNFNAKLESGWTPLSHACFHAQEDIVQFLLDKGADPNIHADSVTPIMLACSNSSANEAVTYNIVSSLIQKDCILNVGDKYGVTPLMRAVISGRVSVVELVMNKEVNIEMRDRHGWTAVFWAIHHNQAQCLELLLSKGARCNIVDRSNRSPSQIAITHENYDVNNILKKYSKSSDDNEEDKMTEYEQENYLNNSTGWMDYYPGLRDENKPMYANEIHQLLYGLNCDSLMKTFESNPIDLRTFLLLETDEMLKLGIEMPFERQRLKSGLRHFHTRSWKVNSLAGLEDQRGEPCIVKCLNVLGTHLQQLYILEATLTYVFRDYDRIQNQIKFEPPDSPSMQRLLTTARKLVGNINNIRREINTMKKYYTKISKENLKPADLITETCTRNVALDVFTQIVVIGSLSYVAYRTFNMFNK